MPALCSAMTYDFLLSIGMKPWIELGYTPCWMRCAPLGYLYQTGLVCGRVLNTHSFTVERSGPVAVPLNSYWPTVDYGPAVEVRFLNQDKRDYYQVSRAEVKQVSKRQASHAAAAFSKTSVFFLFS